MGIVAGVTAAAAAATAGSSIFGGSSSKGGGVSPAAAAAPKPPSGGTITTPGASYDWSTGMGGDVTSNLRAGPGLAAFYNTAPQLQGSLGDLQSQYLNAYGAWQPAQQATLGNYTGALGANLGQFQGGMTGATNNATGGYNAGLGLGLGLNNAGLGAALQGTGAAGANYDYLMSGNQFAPLVAYNSQAQAGLSNLRDTLRQRGVLGSSFGNSQLTGAQAQYSLGQGQLAASLATQDFQNRMNLAAAQSGALTGAGQTAYNEMTGTTGNVYGAQSNLANALYQGGAQTAGDIYNAGSAYNQGAFQNNLAALDATRQIINDRMSMVAQMAGMDLSTLSAATGAQGPMTSALTDYSKALIDSAAKTQLGSQQIAAQSAQGTGQFLGTALGSLNKGSSSSSASTTSGLDKWIGSLFNSTPANSNVGAADIPKAA